MDVIAENTAVVGEYGWRDLAASVADSHAEDGAVSVFIHSGSPVWIYGGRVEAEPLYDTVKTFPGASLKRKDIRQFLWEMKLRKDSPEDVPRGLILWSAYDPSQNRSFLGLGRATRVPKEVT